MSGQRKAEQYIQRKRGNRLQQNVLSIMPLLELLHILIRQRQIKRNKCTLQNYTSC